MRSGGNVMEVIEVKGWLWERPPHDIAQALGDPRLSDCLLFHLQHMLSVHTDLYFFGLGGAERWEHKYRINEKDETEEEVKKEYRYYSDDADELMSDRRVLFVDEVKYYSENNIDDDINEVGVSTIRNASSSSSEDQVFKITLPATSHLFLLPKVQLTHLRQVVKRLNLESIVTLGLICSVDDITEKVVTLSDQLLASPTQSLHLQHLFIFMPFVNKDTINIAEEEKLVERVVRMCLSLHLQGLALHNLPASTSNKVTRQVSPSQRSQLAYLGITEWALINSIKGHNFGTSIKAEERKFQRPMSPSLLFFSHIDIVFIALSLAIKGCL